MFGKPTDYARFLGIELSLWYVGPLLRRHAGGLRGIRRRTLYCGGGAGHTRRSTLLVETVRTISHAAATKTALVDLVAAHALTSRDIRAPLVTAHPAFARRGNPASLHFDVFDDSGRSSAVCPRLRRSTRSSRRSSQRGPSRSGREPSRFAGRCRRGYEAGNSASASSPATRPGTAAPPACAPFLRVE